MKKKCEPLLVKQNNNFFFELAENQRDIHIKNTAPVFLQGKNKICIVFSQKNKILVSNITK